MNIKELRKQRDTLVDEGKNLIDRAQGFKRDLSTGERTRYDQIMLGVDDINEHIKAIEEQDKRTAEMDAAFARIGGGAARSASNPLAYTAAALDAIQGAIDNRQAGRFEAGSLEQRAALATSTFGAPRAWGANVLAGPRLLHVAAGLPTQSVDAIYAQFPQFTLPAAGASVGENVTLAEYATSTAGSVTLARYGRFTDISSEGMIGTDAGSITAMHTIGIAKSLDKALIDAVETAAGSAVTYSADVPAAIRKAMATVLDATAAADPAQLVVLVHPDNAALLQDVTPVGGLTIAESFQRFSGALVYASSAVNTGFITVANVQAGCRYFQARALRTETDLAPKTDTLTLATSVIGGYGIGLADGFASMVDVVS